MAIRKNTVTAKNTIDMQPTIIMGVDPGTVVMGYAVISCVGNKITLLEMDNLKMSWEDDVYERLHIIHQRIDEVIKKFKPTHFAIEAPFFGKNVQSMLKLGRAQGVAIATAMNHSLKVMEYSPKKIKQSITGNGNAVKERVWIMLQQLLDVDAFPPSYDASDALGVAVCHHFALKSPLAAITGSKAKGWETFLKNNPDRIVR
ncbi:crossover junction endodeoxyribonuclease RuvC [Polluticaenibacter yanchengensis]|uniref:Crossover junction endodeoxyribonuclease RuvC n=1 Tax=Polluticaenibacter yanchengensis TaxID=3014562 RepID=A0ABT4UKK0_9BACT|nr:crossover junction endodeoxyribonuclease RuvC [Chitinophagaceae bacterium LY-5]